MLIDTREIRSRRDRSYIHAQLLTRNITCEVRALPLGDFMWILRRKRVASHLVPGDKRLVPGAGAAEVEYVCGFIVERKEVADLAASLVDGRYTEQKHRLVNSGLKATYLIEGDATKIAENMHYVRISPKHIAGAIVSTQVRCSLTPACLRLPQCALPT